MPIQVIRVPILQRLPNDFRLGAHPIRRRDPDKPGRHGRRRRGRGCRRSRGRDGCRLRHDWQSPFTLARHAMPGRRPGQRDGEPAGPERDVFKCHDRWVCSPLYNAGMLRLIWFSFIAKLRLRCNCRSVQSFPWVFTAVSVKLKWLFAN